MQINTFSVSTGNNNKMEMVDGDRTSHRCYQHAIARTLVSFVMSAFYNSRKHVVRPLTSVHKAIGPLSRDETLDRRRIAASWYTEEDI